MVSNKVDTRRLVEPRLPPADSDPVATSRHLELRLQPRRTVNSPSSSNSMEATDSRNKAVTVSPSKVVMASSQAATVSRSRVVVTVNNSRVAMDSHRSSTDSSSSSSSSLMVLLLPPEVEQVETGRQSSKSCSSAFRSKRSPPSIHLVPWSPSLSV